MAKDFRTNVEVTGTLNTTGATTIGGALTASIGTSTLSTSTIIGGTSTQRITLTSGAGNHGIEIGRADSVASTPFIDFHSSSITNDFDARIIASGTSSVSGEGQLTLWGTLWMQNKGIGSTAAANLLASTTVSGYLISSGDLTASAGTTILGNTGIGISPSYPIHVYKSSGPTIMAQNSTTTSQVSVVVAMNNYATSFAGLGMRVYDSSFSSPATLHGISTASLGALIFQNLSAGLIGTNGGSPLILSTNSLERVRIDSSGNFTASVGTTTLGATQMSSASISGSAVATQNWVQAQGYSTSAASIQYSTASLRNTSTTVYQNPTGMTGITLRAGVLYKYEIGILYRVITTNQVFRCRLNHPAFTVGTAHVVIGTNTTQISYLGLEKTLTGTQTTLDSTTTTNAGAGLLHQRVDGFILTSASGVLSYDFAPTSAATGADVFENSYMLVTPVTAV